MRIKCGCINKWFWWEITTYQFAHDYGSCREVTAKQNILMPLRMERTVNLSHRLARSCLSSRVNDLFIDYYAQAKRDLDLCPQMIVAYYLLAIQLSNIRYIFTSLWHIGIVIESTHSMYDTNMSFFMFHSIYLLSYINM